MAQVQLDVLYKVTGLQALKQSQAALNGAANAASAGTNKIRGYNAATQGTAVASSKAAAATGMAAKGYRATGFAAVGATGGVKSFGVALSAALGPIAAITTGLALVGKTITVFSDRQRDVAVLTNGLKNLGLQGTPALDALQASADKLGKTTLFDQEQFTRGYALLTSFKQIGVSSYERVATAAADLAQTTGQDLNSALLQLSKALEDPARRVTDLSRSGTVFTEQQKEQIRVLQESGNILGAQAIILGEIEKQYGGAAEAAGSAGFAGAMDSLGEATRDLMEALGQNLVPMLTQLIKVLSQVIGFVNTLIQKFNDLGGKKIFQFLLKPAGIFGELMGYAAEQVEKTRQNAEDAAPAVSELADQVRDMPKPVKETADQMQKVKQQTDQASASTQQLNANSGQTVQKATELNRELQAQQSSLASVANAQTQVNTATGQGAEMAGLVAQNEQLAAENAALLAQQQASANSQITAGANEAGRLANELQRAASASAGISGGGGGALGRSQNLLGGSSITVDNSHKIYDKYKLTDGKIVETSQAEREQQMNQARLNKMNERSRIAQSWDAAWAGTDYDSLTSNSWRRGGIIGPIGSQMYQAAIANAPPGMQNLAEGQNRHMAGYAEGGYVTGPQQAIIGEGGEPEYVIPASKMDGAMQRYSAGMRGSSMIPSSADVSVNYNGSTVDMGGTSYINKGDVTGIVSQAVNQTLTTLQRSSKARLTAGLR